jgi:nucleoside-diphosphate-sugar epimerase
MLPCSWERRIDMEKTLVTGATGFIGSHVAEMFCNEGVPCVIYVRDQTRLCPELVGRCEVVNGDIRDASLLVNASKGCSSIVHVAGLASDWGSYRDFVDTNIQGTLNVLEACRCNGIRHAVITGSISSYGEEHCTIPKDENSPFNSHYPYFLDSIFPSKLNWYRDTKAEATRRSLQLARAHGLDLTVIEPAWVYGEREFNSGFFSYLDTVRQGLRFLPGSRRNTFHVIYARDLARAYVLALKKRIKGIERILVGNPQPESMHRIFSLFCTQAGLRPPHPVPHGIAYPIGFALELFSTLFRTKKPPLLSRGRVNMFYDSIGYSVKKAERILGFTCQYSLEQGIQKTVAWYRENGYLESLSEKSTLLA